MLPRVAHLISILFFPGLIPSYLIGVVYFTAPYVLGFTQVGVRQKLMVLSFIFLYTFVFPGVLILWLKKRGLISSIFLSLRKDRLLPYLISVGLTYFLAWLFINRAAELVPTGIILIFIATVILIIALISIKWQVSAHSAGMGGMVGCLGTLSAIYDDPHLRIAFYITLLVAGIVVSARLKLGAHSPAETYVGFTIGLVISVMGSFFV